MTSDEGKGRANIKVDAEKLFRMMEKVDNLHDKWAPKLEKKVEEGFKTTNGRLGRLEKWRSGIIAMIVTATGLISAYLKYFME